MKLKHFELENIIDFDKSKIYSLQFEDTKYLFKMVNELVSQVGGGDGEFVLSENLKTLKIDKSIFVFTDYFNIDFNTKQVLNVVVRRLSELSVNSEYKSDFMAIKQKVNDYLKELLFDFDLPVIYDEFDEDALLKAINVHLNYSKKSLLEMILDYMEVLFQNLKISVFVFVNLKPLLNANEYELLCKHTLYNDIKVIFIDSIDKDLHYNGEISIEIDEDKCEFVKMY